MRKRIEPFLPFLVLFFGVLAYVNSFQGLFILDDKAWIESNREIGSLAAYVRGSSRPVTAITFHLNYLVSGRDPVDYHAVNLVIHLWAALLLYGVVRRSMNRLRPKQGAAYGSLVATGSAILWAVHPLQTESVTYIIQRAESLMGFFYLLVLYCFIRGVESVHRSGWFAGAVVACALGMGTKAVMVTAPVMVLLYDRTFVAGSAGNAIRQRKGLYTGLALCLMIVGYLALSPNESSRSAGFGTSTITAWGYLATQPGVIWHYLKLIVWPENLTLDYAWPPATAAVHIVPYALGIAAMVVGTILLSARRHPAGFCLAWFFIVLAPSSSVIPIADYAVEHRLYLPLAGLVVLFTAGAAFAARALEHRFRLRGAANVALGLGIIVLACACTWRTIERNRDYASYVRMTREIARVRPHNFRGRLMLIHALIEDLQFDEAYTESMRLARDAQAALTSPDRQFTTMASDAEFYLPKAYNMAGEALLCEGKNRQAVALLQRALTLQPRLVDARYNLAIALVGLGRHEDALREMNRSLDVDPEGSSKGFTLMGLIHLKLKDFVAAKDFLERGIELDERNMIARLELAWLLATVPDRTLRNGQRAVELAQSVCRLTDGGNHRSLDVLAAGHAARGAVSEAEKIARQALRLAEKAQASIQGKVSGAEHRAGSIDSRPEELRKRLKAYQQGNAWSLDGPWDPASHEGATRRHEDPYP